MMRKWAHLLLLSLGIGWGTGTVWADTLYLEDGQIIETTILNEAETYVEVERDGASVLYTQDEIKKIEWSEERIQTHKEHGGKEHAGKNLAVQEQVGKEHAGKKVAVREQVGKEHAGKNLLVREQVGKEHAGQESAVKEHGGQESADKEHGGRELVGKGDAGRKQDGYELFGSGAEGRKSVSGTVRLFKEPDEKGYLRIQFNQQGGLGYFGIDIEDKNIVSGRATYRIDGVAAGEYKATAWYVVRAPEDALNIHSTWRNVVVRAGRGNRVDFVCDQRY